MKDEVNEEKERNGHSQNMKNSDMESRQIGNKERSERVRNGIKRWASNSGHVKSLRLKQAVRNSGGRHTNMQS